MRDHEVSHGACHHVHAHVHAHGHAHCHADQSQDVAFPKLMAVMSKVSLVGLAVLAACTAMPLFAPAFVAGALYGLYDGCSNAHQPSKEASFSGCSQGFWQDLTGVAFPAPVALLAGVASAAVHIDHHASVFVPLAGFAAGLWCGHGCAPAVSLCFRHFRELVVAA